MQGLADKLRRNLAEDVANAPGNTVIDSGTGQRKLNDTAQRLMDQLKAQPGTSESYLEEDIVPYVLSNIGFNPPPFYALVCWDAGWDAVRIMVRADYLSVIALSPCTTGVSWMVLMSPVC